MNVNVCEPEENFSVSSTLTVDGAVQYCTPEIRFGVSFRPFPFSVPLSVVPLSAGFRQAVRPPESKTAASNSVATLFSFIPHPSPFFL